jgi:hypothetical protein
MDDVNTLVKPMCTLMIMPIFTTATRSDVLRSEHNSDKAGFGQGRTRHALSLHSHILPMPDVHYPDTRSYNMSRIRGKDTKPEMVVRRFLHANGFRYRLHDKKLPGKPDIVLLK